MKKKTRKNKSALRKWARKGKKQSGGFLAMLISGLIGLGMSTATATAAAGVAAPVITGALTATGGIVINESVNAAKRAAAKRKAKEERLRKLRAVGSNMRIGVNTLQRRMKSKRR